MRYVEVVCFTILGFSFTIFHILLYDYHKSSVFKENSKFLINSSSISSKYNKRLPLHWQLGNLHNPVPHSHYATYNTPWGSPAAAEYGLSVHDISPLCVTVTNDNISDSIQFFTLEDIEWPPETCVGARSNQLYHFLAFILLLFMVMWIRIHAFLTTFIYLVTINFICFLFFQVLGSKCSSNVRASKTFTVLVSMLSERYFTFYKFT